jgi:CheY-like chemotaxis protein
LSKTGKIFQSERDVLPTKILIVEDNPDSRDFLATLLKIEGYTIFTAADGIEGIEQAIKNHPDLIISDIMMPNLDGIEMVKALRHIRECQAIPILMVSAFNSGNLSVAMRVGATQGFTKPLDCNLLNEAIKHFTL